MLRILHFNTIICLFLSILKNVWHKRFKKSEQTKKIQLSFSISDTFYNQTTVTRSQTKKTENLKFVTLKKKAPIGKKVRVLLNVRFVLFDWFFDWFFVLTELEVAARICCCARTRVVFWSAYNSLNFLIDNKYEKKNAELYSNVTTYLQSFGFIQSMCELSINYSIWTWIDIFLWTISSYIAIVFSKSFTYTTISI